MKSKNKYSSKMIYTFPLLFFAFFLVCSSLTIASDIKVADCLKHDNATEIHSGDNPKNVTNAGGNVFFTTNSSRWLWKSDQISKKTVLVKSFGENNLLEKWIETLVNVNGTLYFMVGIQDGLDWSSSALWKSDGTPQGTIKIGNIGGTTTGFTVVGETLFFASTDYPDPVSEYWDVKSWLWKSDGTEEGTLRIMNLENEPYDKANHYAFLSHGGSDPILSFFTGNSQTGDTDLWTIKETAPGPPDILQIFDDLMINNAIELNGLVYFFATNNSGQLQLWRSNSGLGGSFEVLDIPGGSLSEATVVNDTLFFTISDDETEAQRLWKTDGTKEGTVMIRSFDGNSISNLTNVDGTLHFSSKAGDTGNTLWRSDGTDAGTTVDIQNIENPIENIIDVGGELIFFTMDKDPDGSEDMFAKDLYRYSAEEGAVNIFSSVDSFSGHSHGDTFEFEVVDSTTTLFFGVSDNQLHKYVIACD